MVTDHDNLLLVSQVNSEQMVVIQEVKIDLEVDLKINYQAANLVVDEVSQEIEDV